MNAREFHKIFVNKHVEVDNFIEKFSSYDRLVKVVCRCLKWSKLKRKDFQFDPEDIERAEHKLILFHQRLYFSKEITMLKKFGSVAFESKLKKLTPFLNNDILRVGGRLSACSGLSYDEKFPIILEKDQFTALIIRKIHITHFHCGNAMTEQLMREKYYVFKLRRQIKYILDHCVTCLRLRHYRYNILMSNISMYRFSDSTKPFSAVGIDLAGPFRILANRQKGSS